MEISQRALKVYVVEGDTNNSVWTRIGTAKQIPGVDAYCVELNEYPVNVRMIICDEAHAEPEADCLFPARALHTVETVIVTTRRNPQDIDIEHSATDTLRTPRSSRHPPPDH